MKTTRILVIEDNEDDQALFRRQLRGTEFDQGVMFTHDPRVALDLLQGPPDSPAFRDDLVAMFIDVQLPYMSGIELLRVIHSLEGMQNFPVILMSSSPRPETVAACREQNAIGFIEKPVTLKKFLTAVAALFHDPVFRTGCPSRMPELGVN